ncbi:TrlF family AAA-like ATPase [Desulfonatronum sp. SC1]|uniref:TrlF family AAA-like ATPase n=1 Tax=Desulfonatronum sp. SC1 TaxID=2109626 RepID=UPI000D2F93A5|nr:histidinol-phosphatase [Desulfonatronum sp. SC1]PTN37336.1 histidinol-phosphatase [Desulfonatronum sp. SC1]
MAACNEKFPQGSRWVRADFHLHTAADKEFSFAGNPDFYCSDYIHALKDAAIEVGLIANHNKFDFDEFKALRKSARKQGIFLLPGVELSVNDGSNGIHTLVVFGEEWLANGKNYINQFLNVAFEGKIPDQYENENGRSSLGLLETIKKLEGYNKDFFLVFAHVEDKSGLWNELDGGRLQELGKSDLFCRRALAFQKVRTHVMPDRKCRVKVQDWLCETYPAEVEGSDPKSIDQIGKGEKCYLKIGDFTFEAVKYALLDHNHRLACQPLIYKHSHIQSVSFDGGVLDGKTINLSPELNTLIGIRGSGKSSIVEAIRYALDIPFGEKALDTDYKTRLVEHALGSGGKITLKAFDQRGQQYEIRRISREKPDVYVKGILQPGISIRETVLHKPIYFGQKDLSSTGEGFEKDLVEKLVGEKLAGIRARLSDQSQKVTEIVSRLKKLSNVEEKKAEYKSKKQDAEFRLEFYKKYGVEERLQKQVDFDADSRKCTQVLTFVQGYLRDLESFINQYEDDLNNQRIYTSKQNKDFFDTFFADYDQLIDSFNRTKDALASGNQVLAALRTKSEEFSKLKEGLKEEFAEIERKLAEQLKEAGVQAIRPEEFRNLRKTVDQATQMLQALEKEEAVRGSLRGDFLKDLAALNDLWHEEFKTIKGELDKVNEGHSSLAIAAEFKGDKVAFINFMKEIFRGSRIRESTFQNLSDSYADFGAMYKDWNSVKREVGNSADVFGQYFSNNLEALLTFQVPNRFTIKYRGKELKHHSLGQRASALILFVLSQQENDVFLIDQPEDDLDNQTIYEDVIKLIQSLKPKTQFVFATHNANFPVLGDAEQVIACSYSDDKIHAVSGSIDCPKLQQEIVDIMEGGEEAFRQRKRRYEIWKPLSSLK